MTTSNQKDRFIHRASLILPFLPEEQTATKLTKDNSVTLELRSIPGDVDSPKVKCRVRIASETETPREIIHWCNDLENQVFPGLGLNEVTSGPRQQAMLKTVTTGNAFIVVTSRSEHFALQVQTGRAIAANADPADAAHLAILAQPLTHAENMTPEVVKHTLQNVIEIMMPRNALQRCNDTCDASIANPLACESVITTSAW